MGNPFSVPCDPFTNKVFECLDEKGAYIRNLKKNLEALDKAIEKLKSKREDLSTRVTREEEQGLERLAVIQVWFDRVESIGNIVDNLVTKRHAQLQRLCLCGYFSKSLRSSYRYGRWVFAALREVQELEREEFKEVTEQARISEVQERQVLPIIVGQETMLENAWTHLRDDKVGIVGMYGMGGVGKTTLLTQLNNKFSGERLGFDFVIWVVVSKELNVEKILNEIAAKIGLEVKEWKKKDKMQKTDAIYNFLRKKKFVLFLDDIWEKVDLTQLGVPFPTPENKCKVAFTTRSQDVCARMGVDVLMEVQCLEDDEAFDLFQKKVGKRALRCDPDIPDLAEVVAKKCSGLPLALSLIGETMSCKTRVEEWHDAINILTYARDFPDMGDSILPLLKFSYDDLKGEHLKSCLLYCALFPEDYEIRKSDLIDYWICEGIIDGNEGIEKAENKGYEIIGSLVRKSLLMEKVKWHGLNDIVCMHDVVREMALWIASDLGAEKEIFIVHAGVGLTEKTKVKNWNVVRRMSLMKNETTGGYIHKLDGKPECRELTTLLLQDSMLKRVSNEFFKSMPKLLVLDLSYNRSLSASLDGISELSSLRYLNLSHTAIRRLPKGLQRLKKLIHLNLDRTPKLSSIDGISSLQNLKILKLVESGITWDRKTVKELEKLQNLEILNTNMDQPPSLEEFLGSHMLTSCTRYLQIHRIESPGISLPGTMRKLRSFPIWDSNIAEIKMEIQSNPRNSCFSSLSDVSVRNCENLRELTFLMFASNLKRIDIEEAYQLEDIIKEEKALEVEEEESEIVPFKKLSFLKLHYVPMLKSIYWKPLRFPCLKAIHIRGCPNLKKLPLDSQSGKQDDEDGLVIHYNDDEWFKAVEWKDEATKTRFCRHSN